MTNLDVIVGVALVVALAAALWWLWRGLRGPARRPLARALRLVCATAVALAAIGALAYYVMNSRTFQLLGDHVSRVDTTQRVVALTFDDGPSDRYVASVLADLARYRARGTFFVIGAEARDNARALGALVVAHEEIGNHTYSHRRLVFVSLGTVANEVESTDRLIRAAGYDGPILFRPPYCKRLVSAPYYLWRHGRTTVTWDLEPDSIGRLANDPNAMTDYVVRNVRPGSIVLMHVWAASRGASRAALPLILDQLAAKGYRFVTVSQLLALR